MSSYIIRYTPGTDLALRFPSIRYPWRGAGFATREQAEHARAACPNADAMEIVEVDG